METENLLQYLSRTAALATKTYNRTLARSHALDRQETCRFHADQNRNVSASVGHRSTNQSQDPANRCYTAHCHQHRHQFASDMLPVADHNNQSLRYRKGPKGGSIRQRNPSAYDKGNPGPCDINTAMKELQEHMDMISLHCECYFDSCPRKHLSRSDRRHLKAFHKGLLRTSPKKRTKSGTSRSRSSGPPESRLERSESSKQPKSFEPLGATSKLVTDSRECLGAEDMEQPSPSPLWADSSDVSEIPESEEVKHLLEEAEVTVRLNSPLSSNSSIGTKKKEKESERETGASVLVTRDRLQRDSFSDLENTEWTVPKFSMARDSCLLVSSSRHKNLYHDTEEPTDGATVTQMLSDDTSSDIDDSSVALMRELERQKISSTEKRVRFDKRNPAREEDQSQNAQKQTSRRVKVKGKIVGHNLDSKSYVQGISVFPTSINHPSSDKNTKGTETQSQACQTSQGQGIVIATKPGRYIIRTRPGGANVTHALNINPGNFVNLSL